MAKDKRIPQLGKVAALEARFDALRASGLVTAREYDTVQAILERVDLRYRERERKRPKPLTGVPNFDRYGGK